MSFFARLAVILLVAVAGVLVLWSVQRRLIYFPFGVPPPPAQVGLPQAETFTFDTEDGLTLGGWFVPAADPATGVTVLVLNGNGGHRGMRAPLAAALASRGVAAVLVDYRGYGGNPGRPTEEGLARDARAALAYTAARRDVDGHRIAYFGESLGSGVAVRLADEQPPVALILRSPFTSLADVGRYHYPFLPVSLLLVDRFEVRDRIRRIRSPLLVVATRRDTIVPFRSSEGVFAAAHEPKRMLVLEDAHHNDYELLAGERMIEAIVEFLGGR